MPRMVFLNPLFLFKLGVIMDLKIIISVFFAFMLIFGCVGGETKTNEENKEPTTIGTTENKNETKQTDNTLNQNQEQTTIDLDSKTWGELQAMGVPLLCEITYKDPEVASMIKETIVYIKGDKVRLETSTLAEGMDLSMIFVMPGDGYTYTKMDSFLMSMIVEPGCVWLKTEVEENEQDPTEVLDDPEQVEIKCVVGNFNDSIFVITEKACFAKTAQ